MYKFISTTAAVAGALAAFTGSAMASEGLKVSYGDLDLSRPADAAAFDQRATRAARAYCRSEPRPVDTFIRDINGCTQEMLTGVAQALPQAQRQALAAARVRGSSTVLAAR
jgi:UrcA family protein